MPYGHALGSTRVYRSLWRDRDTRVYISPVLLHIPCVLEFLCPYHMQKKIEKEEEEKKRIINGYDKY